jgi:SAM-dependent methyltransferase
VGAVAGPIEGDYVQAWHDVHAGATSMVMSRPRDVSGRTSYELLVDAVPNVDGPVVDLACGDGFLIDVLRRRPDVQTVIGVDLNAAELRAARQRLGPGEALLRTNATALPFATSSVSVVTAHFSLMLLLPLDDALAEIARVLQPVGSLVAVVPGPIREDVPNGFLALRSAFAETCADHPIELPPIQDDRILDPDTRATLLDAAGLNVTTDQRTELLDRADPAVAFDQLWLTYGPEAFPDPAQAVLRDRLRHKLDERTGNDGLVPMVHIVDLVVATSNQRDRRAA